MTFPLAIFREWPEGLTSRNGPRGIGHRDLTIEDLARSAGPGKIGQEGFTWKILEKKAGLDGLGAYFWRKKARLDGLGALFLEKKRRSGWLGRVSV